MGMGTAGTKKPAAAALTPAELDRLLKSGARGAYLFCGEESYLKRAYAAKLRKYLFGSDDAAGAAAFNDITLDKDSYSPDALAVAIQTLPVFAERKLIELRDFNFGVADDIEALCAVLELLPDNNYCTVLIYALPDELDPGTAKQPSKVIAAFAGAANVVNFEYETPSRLAKWVERHFDDEGVAASPEL